MKPHWAWTTLLLLLLFPLPALADRAHSWDFSAQLIGNFHASSNGSRDARLDVDSSVGLGFGGGYNVNEHLKLGAELSFLYPDYTATINVDGGGREKINAELDVFNGHLYGAWNFLPGAFTPYVRAGLGWTYVDSNIVSNEVPGGVCWWDPWWGYICSGFYDTYDDTRFSYGAGFGLRYELDRHYFVQGGIDHYEMSGDSLGASPAFDLWRVQFGWRFPN